VAATELLQWESGMLPTPDILPLRLNILLKRRGCVGALEGAVPHLLESVLTRPHIHEHDPRRSFPRAVPYTRSG